MFTGLAPLELNTCRAIVFVNIPLVVLTISWGHIKKSRLFFTSASIWRSDKAWNAVAIELWHSHTLVSCVQNVWLFITSIACKGGRELRDVAHYGIRSLYQDRWKELDLTPVQGCLTLKLKWLDDLRLVLHFLLANTVLDGRVRLCFFRIINKISLFLIVNVGHLCIVMVQIVVLFTSRWVRHDIETMFEAQIWHLTRAFNLGIRFNVLCLYNRIWWEKLSLNWALIVADNFLVQYHVTGFYLDKTVIYSD